MTADVSSEERKTNELPPSEETDFLSLGDIVIMIWRHRFKIIFFVGALTILTGVFVLLQPRVYKAESFLEIIPPVSIEGKVDKDLYETMIVSHMQRVQSAFVAQRAAAALEKQGITISPVVLQTRVEVSRPPRSSLIIVSMGSIVPKKAKALVDAWVSQYLVSVMENRANLVLNQVRLLMQKAQADLVEKQGELERMKVVVAEREPLVTLVRAIPENQLWREIADKTDPEKFKKLVDIRISEQEQSQEYITLKEALLVSEKQVASAKARRTFYRGVNNILESKLGRNGMVATNQPPVFEKKQAEQIFYVENMLRSAEVVSLGKAALVPTSRGLVKKVILVFICASVLSSICAFIVEWLRAIGLRPRMKKATRA